MDIKDFKVDEIVYCKPTGNNTRQYSSVVRKRVVKVKRKYVDMVTVSDDNREGIVVAYCPKTGSTQDAINSDFGGNSGWIFFATQEDYDNHSYTQKRGEVLKQAWSRYVIPKWASEEVLEKMYQEYLAYTGE